MFSFNYHCVLIDKFSLFNCCLFNNNFCVFPFRLWLFKLFNNRFNFWSFVFRLRNSGRLSFDWLNNNWSWNLIKINNFNIFCLSVLNNCYLLFWLLRFVSFYDNLISVYHVSFSFLKRDYVLSVNCRKFILNCAQYFFNLVIILFEFFYISCNNSWLSFRRSSINSLNWRSCNNWAFIN